MFPIAIFVGCDSNGLPSKGADNESGNCKPQTKDFITVNRNHYVVGSAGDHITVDIESNVEYEIYISDDWISYDAKKSCISTN